VLQLVLCLRKWCEELKDHVCGVTKQKETACDFTTTTTTEIAEHVRRKCKLGNYTKRSIKKMVNIMPPRPTPPVADEKGNVDETDKEIWRHEVAAFVKDKKILETNSQNAHSLILPGATEPISDKKLGLGDETGTG